MKKNKIGITFSAFDLFHPGHIQMLEDARTEAGVDYMIVGLQVDPTMERPQKTKPHQSLFERYQQLRACKFVDEIIPYVYEHEILNILTLRHIDVRIIGEEYKDTKFTGHDLDIPLYFNRRKHNLSSSELRSRIASLHVNSSK